jgi:16S rRNA processing protein RimM
MPPRFADMITIGLIVKPQGRKGEVIVEPLSDQPGRFPELERAYVSGPADSARAVKVTACWPHKGRFVLKLDGVDSINDAELFRGLELRIPEAELQALPEGSYYHYQLKGLAVSDENGRAIGEAVDILETGAAPVLVVRGSLGETLVPLAEEFILKVDVAGGRMTVKRPQIVDASADAQAQRRRVG